MQCVSECLFRETKKYEESEIKLSSVIFRDLWIGKEDSTVLPTCRMQVHFLIVSRLLTKTQHSDTSLAL